jgi:hypothetical protein
MPSSAAEPEPEPAPEPLPAMVALEPEPAEPCALEPLPALEPDIDVPDPDPAAAEPEPMLEPEPAIDEPEPGVFLFSSFLPPHPTANATAKNVIAMRMPGSSAAHATVFRVRVTIATLLMTSALAAADPDVRMPPGTHKDSDGQLVSGRGLRDSTDFIAKELDRRGIPVHQVGPYRVRGVELTRFMSDQPSTTWLAIHVVRISGKTVISFVPRPGS